MALLVCVLAGVGVILGDYFTQVSIDELAGDDWIRGSETWRNSQYISKSKVEESRHKDVRWKGIETDRNRSVQT